MKFLITCLIIFSSFCAFANDSRSVNLSVSDAKEVVVEVTPSEHYGFAAASLGLYNADRSLKEVLFHDSIQFEEESSVVRIIIQPAAGELLLFQSAMLNFSDESNSLAVKIYDANNEDNVLYEKVLTPLKGRAVVLSAEFTD